MQVDPRAASDWFHCLVLVVEVTIHNHSKSVKSRLPCLKVEELWCESFLCHCVSVPLNLKSVSSTKSSKLKTLDTPVPICLEIGNSNC